MDNSADRKKFRSPVLNAVIGFLVAGTGLFLAYTSGNYYLAGQENAAWPTTEATITRSEVNTRASFAYDYSVGGVDYTGEKFEASDTFVGSKTYNAELVKQYPAGTRIVISYDPIDPSKSIMKPGANSRDLAMAALGFVVLLFGSFVVSTSFRKSRAVLDANGQVILSDDGKNTDEEGLAVSSALLSQMKKQDSSAFDPLKDEPIKKKTGT